VTVNTYDRHRFDAGLRVVLMAVVGGAAALGVGLTGRWMIAPDIGWAAAAGTFLIVAAITLRSIPPSETGAHATREDGSKTASHVLIAIATIASFGAVVLLLLAAGSAPHGPARIGMIALALGTVALSWLLTHTLFAIRYAALYYDERGGIDFHQRVAPDYADFLYFAFTIGMAFQVSDTDVHSRRIRGAVLRHGMLSYLTSAVVLATTINLVSGLIQ